MSGEFVFYVFGNRKGFGLNGRFVKLNSQYLACMFSLDMNANSNGAFLFEMFT